MEQAGLTRSSAQALPAPETALREWQQPSSEQFATMHPEVVEQDEDPEEQDFQEQDSEDLSIKAASLDLIEKVLRKHGGNRKAAAVELGISERTLYRKIKQMNNK